MHRRIVLRIFTVQAFPFEILSVIIHFPVSPFHPSKFAPQWLSVFLPRSVLLFKIFLPFLDLTLERKPCLRFLTRCEGSYVSLFAPRTWSSEEPGWYGSWKDAVGMSAAMALVAVEGATVGLEGRDESTPKDL